MSIYVSIVTFLLQALMNSHFETIKFSEINFSLPMDYNVIGRSQYVFINHNLEGLTFGYTLHVTWYMLDDASNNCLIVSQVAFWILKTQIGKPHHVVSRKTCKTIFAWRGFECQYVSWCHLIVLVWDHA